MMCNVVIPGMYMYMYIELLSSLQNVNPRPFVEVKSAAPNHIENALRDVHRRATQMAAQQGTGSQLQLLIVILPDVSGSYGMHTVI
jgi:hypothetical protein